MQSRFASRAFTIVELLMIMGIIAVLIALLVVGLRGMQASAARTQSLNSLRQMVAGYMGYTNDNRGQLMPGFVKYSELPTALYDPADSDFSKRNNLLFNVRLAGGNWMYEPDTPWSDRESLQSYVWRLAPYIDHNWRLVMSDYRDAGAVGHFGELIEGEYYGPSEVQASATLPAETPTVADAPSFGLNSIFLGGDNFHGGSDVTDKNPWVNHPSTNPDKIAATRMTESLNPANLIVFAPVGRINPSPTSELLYHTIAPIDQPIGYPELRPPFVRKDADGIWRLRQWFVGSQGALQKADDLADGPGGLPITRHGQGAVTTAGKIPVGNLDGSATIEELGEISLDMRRWAPGEVGLTPPPMDF